MGETAVISMKVAVIGTGYVGLVTGTFLAEIGHTVTCIDVDSEKIQQLQMGKSPIYEPGLVEMLQKNTEAGHLFFTTDYKIGIHEANFIFIAVGTPQSSSGEANLTYIRQAAMNIARNLLKHSIVVTKSTVPVGTNDEIEEIIQRHVHKGINVRVVSNPEFLREGHAIHDSFNGDRILIGSNDEESGRQVGDLFRSLNIPVVKTNRRSAEMIKYASNAFLATKISFINEIANLCESLGADVEAVADGMGFDKRIGRSFLNAGIGYGGSCFPKDTEALLQQAKKVNYDFQLINAVINVNKQQKVRFVEKVKEKLGTVKGKKISVLGLAFKPGTDDTRDAPSIEIINSLLNEGAKVTAYDPIVKQLPFITHTNLNYANTFGESIGEADAVLLVTEWNEFIEADWVDLKLKVRQPILFDGRNCLDAWLLSRLGWEYVGVGKTNEIDKHENGTSFCGKALFERIF